MGEYNSELFPLGSTAPNFNLMDTNGDHCSLDSFKSMKALLVIFMCNHCQYVAHIRQGLVQMTRNVMDMKVGVVAINSNDADFYPEDNYANMKIHAHKYEYPFYYLWDETQETAKAYCAVHTPDFYLFDENRKLIYHGQMDDSRPDNKIPVTGNDLRIAVMNYLDNQPIATTQKPSSGCCIKWRAGNEPPYCMK